LGSIAEPSGKNYAFDPKAVEILVHAFDAAWAIARTSNVVAEEDREALV
jgi:hypothetical protein